MLRRFASSVIRSRGLKNQVNIKWVKPEYVAAYKPERSGDLEALPAIPETALGQDYSLSKEIEDAPDSVKKIFSVAHLGQKEYNALVKKNFIDRVKRHQYDYSNSAESRIARITGHIRCLQDTMEKFPRNIAAKKTVQELIDRRKKLLKFMRQYDYQKFEWLLEKLNIEYKAHPETYHKLTRKESLKKLTEIHCEEIRNRKLEDYRNLLESQQGPYLREKLENLKFIRSEQMDLELPITVTEQDIKKVQQQLDEWIIKDKIKQQSKKKRKALVEIDIE